MLKEGDIIRNFVANPTNHGDSATLLNLSVGSLIFNLSYHKKTLENLYDLRVFRYLIKKDFDILY